MVMIELSQPSNAVVRWLFDLYFLKIMPWIGGKLAHDMAAYKYLPASVVGFPGKEEFMRTLKACGYVRVTHRALAFGVCRLYTGEKP